MMVKYQPLILLSNGLLRLIGNIVKLFSYPFHFCLPKKRFLIPPIREIKFNSAKSLSIPRIIWQTNYSNLVTLPIYCNYLINRLFSLNFQYRYVSTEEREQYIKQHAPKRLVSAYLQLTDGAAQADFWRLFVLYNEGGIYLDIDAHLVWNLNALIQTKDREIFITRHQRYTNFFIASEKNHSILWEILMRIVDNIEKRRTEFGVYSLTGPDNFNEILTPYQMNTRCDKYTCAQGTFSNEYFQYFDKKNGKWTHKKSEELLK